jgi:hypothetical protein
VKVPCWFSVMLTVCPVPLASANAGAAIGPNAVAATAITNPRQIDLVRPIANLLSRRTAGDFPVMLEPDMPSLAPDGRLWR